MLKMVAVLLSFPLFAAISDNEVREKLGGEGLVGRIHGADLDRKVFVLTVRDANDFFNYRLFSLVFAPSEGNAAELKRHDQVRVFGRLMSNPSGQGHILVRRFELMASSPVANDYQHRTEIPGELREKTRIEAQVHAVDREKGILVIDYGDAVIPVYVPVSGQATLANLYRNDVITFSYRVREHPSRPLHLELDGNIRVIDAMVSHHKQQVTYEGHLALFPASPQIKFNVFALACHDCAGQRFYTLVNFRDPEEFARLREFLQSVWDRDLTYTAGRNKLVNTGIKLRVTGTVNVVSKSQANPQIMVQSIRDIEVLSQPE